MIEAAAANQPDAPLRLAELLCERLCHDLSSQLGSLAGAVELAVDDPVNLTEALSVATDSATALTRRLRLLRAAWAGDCGALSPAEIAALVAGHGHRVSLDGSYWIPGW